jgi:hypothetical protein
MQEAQCFRGLFSNRLVGEWTYLLGLAAGGCRGAGVFGKGKMVSPGQDEIRGRCTGNPARSRTGRRNARTSERRATNHREGSIC